MSPLGPLCSHLSCTGVPKEDAIFRKKHFLGPVGYPIANVAHALPSLPQGPTGASCPAGPAGPLLQSCYPASAPPARAVAVGCPGPIQDFGFVFAGFSEVLVKPLLDFERSE